MSASRPSSRRGSASETRIGGGGRASTVRTGLAALLVLLGIAWLVVYVAVDPGPKSGTWGWMSGLDWWNYVIGFGLIFAGLIAAAHPATPLGRGRGVVVGMLGCFLIGLLWIVVYYVIGTDANVPLITALAQYNLIVGIGFMAVGFVYATHWE